MEVTTSDPMPPEPPPGSSSQEVGASYRQGASKPDTPVQKMSKPNDHKSVRPRDNRILEFTNLYGEKKFTRFYSIKPVGDGDLTKLNMFKVDRTIRDQIGTCKKISEDFKEKSWTVEVLSEEQGNKLLKLKKLVQESVKVVAHEWHNQSQGVITCSLLKGYSDEDIAEGLAEQGVVRCRRIIKGMKSPRPEPTTTLILTFNTSLPPSRINIRTGLQERVRPYVPLPMRCFNCQEYGHTGTKCRKTQPICVRCSTGISEAHSSDSCQRPVNCLHCNENHSVTSKSCSRYLLEKEIIAIKTTEHLTFAEARAVVMQDFPTKTRSYSAAVRSKSFPEPILQIVATESSTASANTASGKRPRPLENPDCSPEESRSREKKTRSFPAEAEKTPDMNTSTRGMKNRTPQKSSVLNPLELSQTEGKILNNARKTSKKKAENNKQSNQYESTGSVS